MMRVLDPHVTDVFGEQQQHQQEPYSLTSGASAFPGSPPLLGGENEGSSLPTADQALIDSWCNSLDLSASQQDTSPRRLPFFQNIVLPYFLTRGRFLNDVLPSLGDNHAYTLPDRNWVPTHPCLRIFTHIDDYLYDVAKQEAESPYLLKLYDTYTSSDEQFFFAPLSPQEALFNSVDQTTDPYTYALCQKHYEYNWSLHAEKEETSAKFVAIMPDGSPSTYAFPSRTHLPTMNLEESLRQPDKYTWAPNVLNHLLVWNDDMEREDELYFQDALPLRHRYFEDKPYTLYMFFNFPQGSGGNNLGPTPYNAFATSLAAIFGLIAPTERVYSTTDRYPEHRYEFRVPSGPAFLVKAMKETGELVDFTKEELVALLEENLGEWLRECAATALIKHWISKISLLEDQHATTETVAFHMMEAYLGMQMNEPAYLEMSTIVKESAEKTHCSGRYPATTGFDKNLLRMNQGFLACAILLYCCSDIAFPLMRLSSIMDLIPQREFFIELYQSDQRRASEEALVTAMIATETPPAPAPAPAPPVSPEVQHISEEVMKVLEEDSTAAAVESPIVPSATPVSKIPETEFGEEESSEEQAAAPPLQIPSKVEEPPSVADDEMAITAENTSRSTLARMYREKSEKMKELRGWFEENRKTKRGTPEYTEKKKEYKSLMASKEHIRQEHERSKKCSIRVPAAKEATTTSSDEKEVGKKRQREEHVEAPSSSAKRQRTKEADDDDDEEEEERRQDAVAQHPCEKDSSCLVAPTSHLNGTAEPVSAVMDEDDEEEEEEEEFDMFA